MTPRGPATDPGSGPPAGAAAESAEPGADGMARVLAALDRRQPARIAPDLGRITALLDLLGSPQRAYPSIHVTGTNGKTSTTRMIDSLLLAFGLSTGRYTSPHLHSVTERIAISGAPISTAGFVRTYDELAPYLAVVDARMPARLTFFEVTTAMAFAAFADAPVDVGVVEVGLGGRWDATNVVYAPVVVITPIGLDHAEYLGTSVSSIAAEKAGIVHAEAILISAEQTPEAAAELSRRVREVGATEQVEGEQFGVLERSVAVGGQLLALQGLGGRYDEVFLPLHGRHQAQNAATALAAVEAFLGGGRGRLDAEAVREGFAAATSPGRLERVRSSPTMLVDAAHNPAGAAALVTALQEEFEFSWLVGVLAVLADKDARGILTALEPVLAEVVVTANSSPRALPADELAALAVEVFGPDRVLVETRLDAAVEAAVRLVDEHGDLGAGVVITGSVVTAADARRLLRPGWVG